MGVKILFLDIDGVLNSTEFIGLKATHKGYGKPLTRWERQLISKALEHWEAPNVEIPKARRMIQNDIRQLDRAAIERLNEIIRQTGAKIVVSSTWRMWYRAPGLQLILSSFGLQGDVIDRTWLSPSRYRAHEIRKWLEETSLKVESFVAIDDDSFDMVEVADRLVKTSCLTGLLDEHIERAVEILRRPI
jgi:hypothetical protein